MEFGYTDEAGATGRIFLLPRKCLGSYRKIPAACFSGTAHVAEDCIPGMDVASLSSQGEPLIHGNSIGD